MPATSPRWPKSPTSDRRYRFERVRHLRRPRGPRGDLREFRPDAVMHLAAETHVDRSIDGPARSSRPTWSGTFTLLRSVTDYWRGLPDEARGKFRFHHISTDEVFGSLGDRRVLHRGDALRPAFALFGVQGRLGPPGARLAPHLRPADAGHQLLEQLRPVPVPREADPADDPQRAGGQAAAGLRHGATTSATGCSSTITPAPCPRLRSRRGSGETYNIGGHTERTNLEVVQGSARLPRRAAARAPTAARTRADHLSSPTGPATTAATRSTPPRSSASWAGGRRDVRDRPRARRSPGISTTRTGAATSSPAATAQERLGLAAAHEPSDDHLTKGIILAGGSGTRLYPADPGGQQAAAAGLRQADDLLPAVAS